MNTQWRRHTSTQRELVVFVIVVLAFLIAASFTLTGCNSGDVPGTLSSYTLDQDELSDHLPSLPQVPAVLQQTVPRIFS